MRRTKMSRRKSGRREALNRFLSSSSSIWLSFTALIILLCDLLPASASPALSDPQVDKYNTRVSTQTFSGLYQFTTNNLLIETAQAILAMGSDNIKMFLGSNYPGKYNTNLAPSINSLMTLARNEPNCRAVFDMPFRRIIAWAYPFSNPDAPFQDGNYTATEAANDYREMYDLTRYVLTNYNNSGKTFYFGHWEGDGYLKVNNWTTNPAPGVTPAMVSWLNQRQKAIDDAKAATVYSNVNVYGYAEVNRVRDAMLNGANNNQRAINYVIPYVTNLDYVSYSSYDAMNLSTADLYTTLDYIEAHIPTNKASAIPGERLWIGEYGWGSNSSDSQEPLTRSYIQRLLNYGNQAFPFILFWEIYDNEVGKNFWLIDTNNVKVPCWYLHNRFINNARLFTARFKENHGRLPTDSEFVSLVSPALDNPLPAPINLAVANLGSTVFSDGSASVAGSLAQGVYGDERATVRVYYGRQDGGVVRSAWESSQTLGVNTNFNPVSFTTILTNLAPNTNYFFRFYATNASGESWAPATAQFSNLIIDPSSFGSRMKFTFSGYTRSETLTNFPVLINLSTNLPGFSYRQFASASGGDLRFADSDGTTVIPHEIDEWNTNGTSTVWVRVPHLSGPAGYIWGYWGNPVATTPAASSTNGEVWSPGHLLVWHLKESGFPFADSTLQHPALAGAPPVSTAGEVGRGCLFNGTSQYLDAGPVDLGDAFTLSAWVNVSPTAPAQIQTIWANQKGGFGSAGFAWFVNTFNNSDHKIDFASGDGVNGNESTTAANAITFGAWHHVAVSVNRTNGTADFFVDGLQAASSSAIVPTFANDADLNFGRFTNATLWFKGVMDETRIETGTRSSNWVWASSMTAASNALFSAASALQRSLPTLSVTANAGRLSLNWPASGVGFALYTATNLLPPIAWILATNQPSLTGTQWQISLPIQPSGAQFFRLQAD